MRLIVHPAARREFGQALAWTRAEFGSQVAARLQRRIAGVGRLLLREPEIGTPTVARARKFPLGPFPYTLVYRAEGEQIHVIALMHQRRLPEYWVRRE